jgi:NAD(P)-dependent dehydrogenase (short-subunit alcohol dehydrogenase family)
MDKRKVAIVTGGASGIGHALCKELVAHHVFVIIMDINNELGRQVE